jgi:hypothetical protein
MKHMVASLTIGACLLLPLAGVVFATDIHGGPVGPHPGGLGTAMNGQPGTGGAGASCGAAGATPPPGQALNSSVNSPFNATSKEYAGAGAGNPAANSSAHANSQYDVSCFQMH